VKHHISLTTGWAVLEYLARALSQKRGSFRAELRDAGDGIGTISSDTIRGHVALHHFVVPHSKTAKADSASKLGD
jgi:hypothetical protein